MTGWLTDDVGALFGDGAVAQESYGLLTVDVPPTSWTAALRTAHSELGCTYFDWLSAVDEPGTGFRVSAHVVALAPVRRLLLRTTVPHDAPVLASVVDVYAGASWHERETHEMFGIDFEGHPHLVPLLLPDGFEGHPLRKDFVLASRVVKAWPGAKEPGESEHGGPRRRQMLPPGVPDPNEWGPHKGTLPAAPARPARGARTGTGEGSAGERAPRGAARPGRERRPRRMRTAAEGSASQSTAQARPSGSTGSAGTTGSTESSGASGASESTGATAPVRPPGPPQPPGATRAFEPRSADAPWHHDRPAFDERRSERPERPGHRAGAAADRTPRTPDGDARNGNGGRESGRNENDDRNENDGNGRDGNGRDGNPSAPESPAPEPPGPDTPRGGPR